MRRQGFIHPAKLVHDELEYAEGYKARMDILKSKMTAMDSDTKSDDRKANYEDPD